jgi:hypothetical protein
MPQGEVAVSLGVRKGFYACLPGPDALRDGLRLAGSKVGKIAEWAAISATVGLILRSLEERFGFLGDLIVGLIGVVWGAVTFFVVPVLLYEPVGAVEGIKRSRVDLQTAVGGADDRNVAIGLAVLLLGLPLLLLAVLVGLISIPAGVVIGSWPSGLSSPWARPCQACSRLLCTGTRPPDPPEAFSTPPISSSFRPRKG